MVAVGLSVGTAVLVGIGTVDVAVVGTLVTVGLTADPLVADDVAVVGTAVAVGLAMGTTVTVEVSVAVSGRVGLARTFSSLACDPAQEAPKNAKKRVKSNAAACCGSFCSME
jgi:hypothetical protein